MATRKWHLLWGVISFGIFAVIYVYLANNKSSLPSFFDNLPPVNLLLLMVAFFMTLMGAELPDWDLILGWLSHRDILTHSIFIPIVITVVFIFESITNPGSDFLVFSFAFGPLFFGYASHLFLDLFPTIDPEKHLKQKGLTKTAAILVGGAVQGLTGTELIKAMKGTYLIHLPFKMPVTSVSPRDKKDKFIELRKTFPLHATRWWLFFNGLICIVLGVVLLFLYI